MSTKRWLEPGSDAGELERELLRAGLDTEPPAHVEDAVFERLRTTLGPHFSGDGSVPTTPDVTGAAAAAHGATAGAKAVSTTIALFGKGVVVGVGFSVAVVGGTRLLEKPTPVSESRAPVELASPAPAELPEPTHGARPHAPLAAQAPVQEHAERRNPSLAEPPSAPAPVAAAPVTPPAGLGSVAAFPPTASSLTSASQLGEEAQMLRRARDQLRAGALTAAFATLEASRRQFSAPELVQEREALGIELLYRSGETASAGQRARAFLQRFPESPHAARIRGFVAGAP